MNGVRRPLKILGLTHTHKKKTTKKKTHSTALIKEEKKKYEMTIKIVAVELKIIKSKQQR